MVLHLRVLCLHPYPSHHGAGSHVRLELPAPVWVDYDDVQAFY